MKVKNTKTWRFLIMLLVIIIYVSFFSIFVNGNTVKAATSKTAKTEKSFLFAVPEGGWSSARIQLKYTENYSIKNGKSVFTSRLRTVMFARSGATVLPQYDYGTLKHSNKKSFTSWKKQTIMYSDSWNSASSYKNSTKVTYSRTTKIKGTLNAIVVCQGAAVPTRAVSVSQRLNTK